MGIVHRLAPIERCVKVALQRFEAGDMQDAIYQISPAVDVTAKRRSPNTKVGTRIKSFIRDEQALIYYLSSQGKVDLPENVKIIMVDEETNRPVGNSKDHAGELADFIYHNIRCAQSHDAEIDSEYIDFGRNFGIGRLTFTGDGGPLCNGMFVVSRATVLALILSVICAPENLGLQLPGDIVLYGICILKEDKLVGDKEYLMRQLKVCFGGPTPTPGSNADA